MTDNFKKIRFVKPISQEQSFAKYMRKQRK
jgi:hypothetical protein